MLNFRPEWLLFAQDTAAAGSAGDEGGSSMAIKLAVVLVVLFGPFVTASLIARMLKLNDLSFKMGVVLFTAVLGLTPFLWQIAQGGSWKDAIKLGIDLAGGANLVFQVDREAAQQQQKVVNSELMGRMIGAISRRLDPASQEQITVRQVGSDRIEVIIPGADREAVESKKKLMTRLGSLEFAILANRRKPEYRELIAKASNSTTRDIREGGRIVASWREVGWQQVGETRTQKDVSDHGEVAAREVERDGQKVREFLVVFEPPQRQVTGQFLTRAYQTTDESGRLAVGFQFNTQGGYRFSRLTSAHAPMADGFRHRLAILLDGQIHSAPNLEDTISTTGIISGSFTKAEIDELINVLNAGALAVPIKPNPISENTISPLLGIDVQEKGLLAITVAASAVVLFMLVYYGWFAGTVADVCLALNLVLVMGVMALIKATFTLPGLAGIVLTIGMAVDANVLIFERIREELDRGSSMRMAIQNGFGRAFTTIVDANVTTLITAVVLYMIGTDQVRGFAVTLFIGIVMSMYSALFFGRLCFDIFEQKRWLKKLRMLHIVGRTHWDFLSKRFIAAAGSLLLIVIGMGALIMRGDDNLDIDLSGGTMVTFQFVEPQNIDEIRGILQGKLGTSISLEQLSLLGEEQHATQDRQFRVRTKDQDVDRVRRQVDEALSSTGHALLKITVDYSEIESIAASSEPAGSVAGNGSDSSESSPNASADSAEANPFAGGHKVQLNFSGEIKMATVEDYVSAEIARLTGPDGRPKYDNPASLLSLEGTAGSGVKAEERETRRFTQMALRAQPVLDKADLATALAGLAHTMDTSPIFEEINTFEGQVAHEMQQSAVMALIVSLVAIVAYIWLRFQRITFGLAAVAALVHDVLVVMGMVALASYASGTAVGNVLDLYDFKINLPMIAAFLTIVGYSLNDTIVVFDRIREVRGKNPALTEEMVNTSLNQTLSRTILTSLTTFIVVAILYAIGGEGIHGFAFCLVIGIVVGTYSSIYVASPVLLWLMNREPTASSGSRAAA